MGKAAYIGAIVLYAVVGDRGDRPRIVRDMGLTAAPARIEAVLLSALVFLGVNVAWLLLFDVAPRDAAPAAGTARRDGVGPGAV